MLVVTVKDTSEELWSLKGWSLKYKQLDADTYGWYLVDPAGNSHKTLIRLSGMNVEYNVRSLEHFIKNVLSSDFTKTAIQKYVEGVVEYSTITL